MKLEQDSPIRSFKHRGALAAIERIAAGGEVTGVVTASTGNHGQGVAYAASRSGLTSIVYAPEGSLSEKLAAMSELGADVRVEGSNLAESQALALAAAREGIAYIEDGESPDLMAGAATVMSEVIESEPGLDLVLVPVGGGNLVAGSLLARAHLGGEFAIYGVQSTAASAATQSWLAGHMVDSGCDTFAGGLATTRPGQLALDVMSTYLDGMALVDEDDLYRGMGLALSLQQMQIEGAAAAPLAALERFSEELPGERVGLVMTGGWASPEQLQRAQAMFSSGTA